MADRDILAWAFYDFASTPFVVLIVTVGYSTYFKDVVVQGAREGDFLWGLAGSLSMAATALIAPYLGAYADAALANRRLLALFTLVTVASTALLAGIEQGMVLQGMIVFGLANLGFQTSQVFYNSFLHQIAPPELLGSVSGFGFALGYVGALVALLAALPFFWNDFASTNLGNIRILFVLVAVFYMAFSIPALARLRDRSGTPGAVSGPALHKGWRRLRETIAHLRRYRGPFRFLISYFIYMDAITTLMVFVAIFGRNSAGLDMIEIAGLFLISQTTAIPGSLFFGHVADRIGAKHTIAISLGLWILILIIALGAVSYAVFLVIALLAGAGTGSLLSVSRSYMAHLAPADQMSEFFGFYAVAGRFSAILGPVVFGAISSLTGNQRYALVSLIAMMIGALFVLRGVEEGPEEHA